MSARPFARRPFPSLHAALLLALVGWAALAGPATAATLPAGFAESLVSSGLTNPTAMALAPDGRLFVCEQGGQLRVIKNGALLAAPFLSVTVNSSGERGLLGVVFDPAFPSNPYVYVYYTATTPTIHNRVSRFTANGDVAVAGSETVLLNLNDLSSATNHNGGSLHFGKDGKLYIGVGENANGSNSQTLGNLLGKILRINPDGTIPSDNPFFGTATGVNRAIWVLGLRNPFTFSFQPGSGRMLINDVGQSTWEEIDDGIAGSNYGWPTTEGPTTDPRFRSPIFSYGHGTSSTTGCAITGGTFYDPPIQQFPPAYTGTYFFADFCSGWIRRLDPGNGNAVTDFASGINAPVDLLVAPDGSLYYLARGAGAVYRVSSTTASPALAFYTLPPCRALDTRSGAPLAAGVPRTLVVAGTCGVPAGAVAVAANLTVVGPTGAGYLNVYPTGQNPPLTSTQNFTAGQTRANNAVLLLAGGEVDALVALQGNGQADLVIDVVGYFL
ncbi:MAG TPA: PQQ-dependent sugar dehydrogenase [Thermoanaerobaculia bacterium]|nr:PQQ-dependent sugar dehydrogenase [Thermoanaerobaculia bacterium]